MSSVKRFSLGPFVSLMPFVVVVAAVFGHIFCKPGSNHDVAPITIGGDDVAYWSAVVANGVAGQ